MFKANAAVSLHGVRSIVATTLDRNSEIGTAYYPKGLTMLVLSRKQNEVVWIGDQIKISVVLIRGNKVRLAISAPRDIQIMRGELVEFAAFPQHSLSLISEPPIQFVAKPV